MSNGETYMKIASLLVVIFLVSLSNVQSQDLFREMDQVKRDISDLRSELRDLRDLVYSMRKVLLQSVTVPPQRAPEKAPPKEGKTLKQDSDLSDEELTRIICKAVGRFFSEAEAALASSDLSRVREKTTSAWENLNATLRDYSGGHRVNKLLNIYEGLAWDTYLAVQQRGSIRGNQEFMQVLQRHKKKYIDTCPKD